MEIAVIAGLIAKLAGYGGLGVLISSGMNYFHDKEVTRKQMKKGSDSNENHIENVRKRLKG